MTDTADSAPDVLEDDSEAPATYHRGKYQLLPPLTPEEIAQLEASIRVHGVEDPIMVDEDGNTLDGHHRREIADRLGISYATREITGLSEDEKRLYAIRRNTERRQLTKAQRALVGLQAEPAFRAEAKARQGTRTDLSSDPAKSRRVWAAEEAARLVGLPLTTYKTYRNLIIAARRERGAAEVEGAIELGRWDMAEVRVVANEREQREAAERREADRRARFPTPEEMQEQVAKLEEDARQAWQTHGLLGRKTQECPSDDDLWQCPSCEAYWPPEITSCRRCGGVPVAPTEPRERELQEIVDTINAEPPTVAEPLDPLPVSPYPRYVPDRPRLKTEDTNQLHRLRRSRLEWYVRADPRELAPLVIEDWSPHSVAELRDGIRVLSGWLAALDTALSAARLGTQAAGERTEEHPDV